MADTRAGTVATDRHRRRQVAIATRADSEIRRAWRQLDPDNIDGTRMLVDQQLLSIVRRYYGYTQAEAAEYLSRYRLAEIGTSTGALVTPSLDQMATVGVIDAYGPQALKRQIKQGASAYGAYQQVGSTLSAEVRKMILSGGRNTVRTSGQADRRAVGWRRVSDGDPCTFCAMLVSRGPAYTSEAKALAAGNGDPYHKGCGCTVEVIYSDWQPTELEQQWVDDYYSAARSVSADGLPRTAENVLPRMRARGKFRDSPAVRRKPAAA